jgi:hypothetical protein
MPERRQDLLGHPAREKGQTNCRSADTSADNGHLVISNYRDARQSSFGLITMKEQRDTVTTASGLRVRFGNAGDPFRIEPDVLYVVGHAFQDGTTVNLSGWDPGRARNLIAGHRLYSLIAGAGTKSGCGAWHRSLPTPGDGVPSTA